MKEVRSGIALDNLQEIIDASATSAKATVLKGQAQYFTPAWFARQMAIMLPGHGYSLSVVFDPQCGEGALLEACSGYNVTTFGCDIDNRFEQPDSAARPSHYGTTPPLRFAANCVDVWRLLDEFYPDLTFRCQVANPPFGHVWRDTTGEKVDSTVFTWNAMLKRADKTGCGFLIANRSTIERFSLDRYPEAYLYQTFPTGIFDANVEIGVLHFHGAHITGAHRIQHRDVDAMSIRQVCDRFTAPDYDIAGTAAEAVRGAFITVRRLLSEEKKKLPPYNIYLDSHGYLKTYLSTRELLTRKLTAKDIERLAKIDKCHPLTLTTERDSRVLMAELVACGVYTVQPEAKAAIESALKEMESIACPIMPITDFERVAYADENEALLAIKPTIPHNLVGRMNGRAGAFAPPGTQMSLAGGSVYIPGRELTDEKGRRTGEEHPITITPGNRYTVSTGSYSFTNGFKRMRLHMSRNETYAEEHDLTLSGQDRYIEITDDTGTKHRFLDRPDYRRTFQPFEHSDEMLWQIFEKPEVQTVLEKNPEHVKKNLAIMEAAELLAGFEYFPGQRDFYSRVAVRDYALVGAATGTGKTLGAITLVALKAPQRALIVAPQGTTKGGKKGDSEDDVEDMQASQWISELRRFAPGLQVFELFSVEDYERILELNNGVLPHGVYVSYYEAMFSNGGREWFNRATKYGDRQMAQLLGIPDPDPEHKLGTRHWVGGIGEEKHGIRCIVQPCLATRIGHLFDFVALDEAHKMCHLSANLTQMIIRMQPRYRYALTATPIPNLVSDIFSIMGWLCVPNWYRGKVRNAAWPYSREEFHRFQTTFLSIERDLTQERMNKEADENWKGKCEKPSPIISSPARLLKLIKPTMAFISKEACNPHKPKVTVHDIRVPFGKTQSVLYGHYMNRANVPYENPMVAAAVQVAILRDLCTAPATSDWNRVATKRVVSNFNPKTAAILSLIRDILARGEQVVVVNSRLNQTEYLAARLREAGVPYSRIDSSLTPDRHTEQANLFKRKATPVMFMGIKCAQAHSFDQCPNEIVGSLEYSFGSFDQASGRIDRVTSKLPMHIYCVLHKNSIEEIMFDVVATKGDAATICLRGQRVPRSFVPADVGDVLAKNFAQFENFNPNTQPDELVVESEWPGLCKALRAAVADHPCQLARKGS